MLNADDRIVSFKLSPDQWRKADIALAETPGLIRNAFYVFDLLASGFSSGGIQPDEPGVVAMFELCARAFREARDCEAETIKMLDGLIRKGMMP